MSNIIPEIGSTSLGIVMGWLVRYFIRRFDKFNPKVFSSVVSILVGGVIVKYLGTDQNVLWFYPIGLLLGFAIYHVIATIEVNKERRQASTAPAAPAPAVAKPAAAGASGGGGGGGFVPGDKNQPLYAPKKD